MMTLQNLDVRGTSGVHRGDIINPFQVNGLIISGNEHQRRSMPGCLDQSDRYLIDLYEYFRSEDARPPIAGALFISEGPSTASRTGARA